MSNLQWVVLKVIRYGQERLSGKVKSGKGNSGNMNTGKGMDGSETYRRVTAGRSGRSVADGFGQAFVDQLLCRILTATASGTKPAALRKMGDLHGAVIDGLQYLSIGHGFAQAYVHELAR